MDLLARANLDLELRRKEERAVILKEWRLNPELKVAFIERIKTKNQQNAEEGVKNRC